MDSFFKRCFKGDNVVWMIYFALIIFSVVEMFSASSQFVSKSGGVMGNYFKHLTFLATGFGLMLISQTLDSKVVRLIFGWLLLACSIVLLLYTSFNGFTADDGAKRWISLFGMRFQPSEIAKFSLVIVAADWIDRAQNEEFQKKWFVGFMICVVAVCGLIMVENLSTAVILFGAVFCMFFVGKIATKRLLTTVGIVVATVVLFAGVAALVPEEHFETSYISERNGVQKAFLQTFKRISVWEQRIFSFSTKENDDEKFVINDRNLQTQHAQIAIAKGGFFGVGPGNSKQRNRIPEASNDFIFSVMVEELGFILGGIVVIALYLILLFRVSVIARKCETIYPALLCVGLGLIIVIQAFIHIGVNVGIGPVTGQPLPLISRGGTSIWINNIYFGLILGVARNNEKQKLAAAEAETNNENLAQEKRQDESFIVEKITEP